MRVASAFATSGAVSTVSLIGLISGENGITGITCRKELECVGKATAPRKLGFAVRPLT